MPSIYTSYVLNQSQPSSYQYLDVAQANEYPNPHIPYSDVAHNVQLLTNNSVVLLKPVFTWAIEKCLNAEIPSTRTMLSSPLPHPYPYAAHGCKQMFLYPNLFIFSPFKMLDCHVHFHFPLVSPPPHILTWPEAALFHVSEKKGMS